MALRSKSALTPLTLFARDLSAEATFIPFSAWAFTCHLYVSRRSKSTPSHRRYGFFRSSVTVNAVDVTDGLVEGSLSAWRLEKCISSDFSESKVIPSAWPQSRASCRRTESTLALSSRELLISRRPRSSA